LNEDGSKHFHKTKEGHLQRAYSDENHAQESSSLVMEGKDYGVPEESVQRGITAFSMVTNLTILVEQTQKQLVTMDEKLNRLLNLAERK
jgi:hypothetical protein